jgi:hypothetical protein
MHLIEEALQGAVIGAIEGFDAVQGFIERQGGAVDLLAFADNPRDRAKAARHPDRTGIHIAWQGLIEHAGIEFIGLAVHIEEGAREIGTEHGGAQLDDTTEEFIDVTVFGAAERQPIEP